MKVSTKWGYESPESEEIHLISENEFLASVYSDKDPVGGAEEGETDDWGWN